MKFYALTDDGQEIRIGECWQIILDRRVMSVRIIELSVKVVVVMELPFSFLKRKHLIGEIKFVERCSDGESDGVDGQPADPPAVDGDL